MIIYGRNAVAEALAQGQADRLLIARGLNPNALRQYRKLADRAGVPVEMVPRIELDRLVRTTSHQGIAAELPDLHYSQPGEPARLARGRGEQLFLVLLDQVQDPHNYGAIIRSAEVLGAHGVVTEERLSAPLTAVVAKTAAGAASHLPLVQVKNLSRYLDELKERNVWVYGADGSATNTPDMLDWNRDAALVIGSEGTGLRRIIRDKCDDLVGIPTRGKVESLNASVAAGILIYEILRSRED